MVLYWELSCSPLSGDHWQYLLTFFGCHTQGGRGVGRNVTDICSAYIHRLYSLLPFITFKDTLKLFRIQECCYTSCSAWDKN